MRSSTVSHQYFTVTVASALCVSSRLCVFDTNPRAGAIKKHLDTAHQNVWYLRLWHEVRTLWTLKPRRVGTPSCMLGTSYPPMIAIRRVHRSASPRLGINPNPVLFLPGLVFLMIATVTGLLSPCSGQYVCLYVQALTKWPTCIL
jgi:hypothetical protein